MKNHSSLPMFTMSVSLLVCFGLLPQIQAVSPPPDGCYPGFTTAEGCDALNLLTSGIGNTALGWRSLFSDTTGNFNTGVGAAALVLNTGDSNTAVGTAALLLNTIASRNTAVGTAALLSNDTGPSNTAVGYQALFANVSGLENTAIGDQALLNNTGNFNVAVGGAALLGNAAGNQNTACGSGALNDTTGDNNTALGFQAGILATTGDGNVYIGAGMSGVFGEANHTYVRNINTTSVNGMGTDTVTVNLTTGLLGHLSSSRRYKEDIKPMDKTSEVLYMLSPVTYRFKKDIDSSQSLDYGLIAEEVAKVDPNLAIRDGNGQIESVRYSAINTMLLNEFLKEHTKVEEQQTKLEQHQATIAELKSAVAQQLKGMAVLTAQLKEQAAQIQKVSAQLEASKPAPQVVNNNQ
jgi:Chaperone of endosialidase